MTEKPLLIGTGGFSSMFEKNEIFDEIIPDLALKGLYLALKLKHLIWS
jgi:type III pantothenate kinase